MAELFIALAPLLLLAAVALVAIFVPLLWLAGFAFSLMLLGALFGLPCGLYYHLLLRRALARAGPLPKGWYWQPQRYHERVDPPSLAQLRPWFVAGAAGFALIIAGFLLAVLALVLWFRAGNTVLP